MFLCFFHFFLLLFGPWFLPLCNQNFGIFFIFGKNKTKQTNKPLKWANRINLYSTSDFTWLCMQVSKKMYLFFLCLCSDILWERNCSFTKTFSRCESVKCWRLKILNFQHFFFFSIYLHPWHWTEFKVKLPSHEDEG